MIWKIFLDLNILTIPSIAISQKSKNRPKFLCLAEFQSHHTLRLLLLRALITFNYKEKVITFTDWQLKRKGFWDIETNTSTHIMTCAWRSAIRNRISDYLSALLGYSPKKLSKKLKTFNNKERLVDMDLTCASQHKGEIWCLTRINKRKYLWLRLYHEIDLA